MDLELDDRITGMAKIIIIGDSGVGKSNLLLRFNKDKFSQESKTTIGVEFESKTIAISGDRQVKVNFWDTAGQERFKTIARVYYKGALGALVVFDITKYETFENLGTWLDEYKQYGDQDGLIVIVGNKVDKENERVVSQEEATKFAQERNYPYFETSAKENTRVKEAFQMLVQEICDKKAEQVFEDLDYEFPQQDVKQIKNEPIKLNSNEKDKIEKKDSCCQIIFMKLLSLQFIQFCFCFLLKKKQFLQYEVLQQDFTSFFSYLNINNIKLNKVVFFLILLFFFYVENFQI